MYKLCEVLELLEENSEKNKEEIEDLDEAYKIIDNVCMAIHDKKGENKC